MRRFNSLSEFRSNLVKLPGFRHLCGALYEKSAEKRGKAKLDTKSALKTRHRTILLHEGRGEGGSAAGSACKFFGFTAVAAALINRCFHYRISRREWKECTRRCCGITGICLYICNEMQYEPFLLFLFPLRYHCHSVNIYSKNE